MYGTTLRANDQRIHLAGPWTLFPFLLSNRLRKSLPITCLAVIRVVSVPFPLVRLGILSSSKRLQPSRKLLLIIRCLLRQYVKSRVCFIFSHTERFQFVGATLALIGSFISLFAIVIRVAEGIRAKRSGGVQPRTVSDLYMSASAANSDFDEPSHPPSARFVPLNTGGLSPRGDYVPMESPRDPAPLPPNTSRRNGAPAPPLRAK